ncbi:Rqc2 family fibronectin-binding protein [Heyndrickxia oleronia]|jgi:predicted ribosome quality control (RQC) complex YloA/Tae2 family protein|uniref:Rqc2 family fibronectin-binding protein n=1 Tax=Heyndrickxia oleronia TaxID=38875 RepID=UPI00242A543A|nr:NFACT RNA binding domain-containing protein [Heyndrickxia oleronia]MCI1589681.1 NFACT family protein [Heyndrickxia oleronia]MCI1615551.1 NFACT family protein [Heyndrickxia oleronia]MCI1746232.1 NFACT family protein [Heyndrickxia oleronia]MCI1763852.1 NFACT family protein [Heyndrickxia oleronia]
MSFDGLFTRAMTKELADILKGGRINKIHQPYKNEMIMIIRANGKNHKLILSAHPSYARIQLTKEQHENPQEPSMFCMLLRKHLEGYLIEDIYQTELDRVVIFEIKGRNEIGDISYKQLYIEIMGRHSNIILVDKDRNMILDSIKHVPPAVNSYRSILPGQTYIAPPKQDKLNPLAASEDDILRTLDFNSGKIDKQIVEHFSGMSPLLAKEIVHNAGLANRVTIPQAFLSIMNELKQHNYLPSITSSTTKEAFYLLPITYLDGEVKSFETISEMLDRYYFGKAERDRVKQQGHDLERFIKNEKEKNESKIEKLKTTLIDAKNADQYQLFGELLTANLHLVKKGMEQIEVVNYYDEHAKTVNISLDPRKSPSANAQAYFSKYQKAKNAIGIVQEQIDKAAVEIQYFERLMQQMESASPKDIEEIRTELAEEGYIKLRQKRGTKNKSQKLTVEAYSSSDGTEILVGKNNKQNDYLTNKLAARDEIWLHTKDIPGSHVVIRSKNPSEETLLEAANLAAYFSKAKDSSSVPVDYTKVRNVKKPNGAKPGFVIYEQQQTVYVTPTADKVLSMKK